MGHRNHCIALLRTRPHSPLPCTIRHLPVASLLKRTLLTIRPIEGSALPQLIKVRDVAAPHVGHIRTISLNSPHNRNAISTLLLAELREQILKLKDHNGRRGGTRVLILASEIDEAFCAGADLRERARMNNAETNIFLQTLRSTLSDLSELSIPTISVVTSNALGGGFELALATHLRVFTNVATVGFPETQLGIIPGAGGTYRLRHLAGESRAHEMVLTGRTIHGSQAYGWGICNWSVKTDKSPHEPNIGHETEEVQGSNPIMKKVKSFDYKDGGVRRLKAHSFALNVAKSICKGAPVAVAAALHAVREANTKNEALMYKLCMTLGYEDRAEGLRAFKEKRSPIYKGAPKSSKNTKAAKSVVHKKVSEETESQLSSAEGEEEKVEDPEDVENSETLEYSEGSGTSEAPDVHGESESETSEMSEREDESEESTARDRKEQD